MYVRTIITAAHCLSPYLQKYNCTKLTRIALGAMDLGQASDGMYSVKISKIERHSKFNESTADYDVAIITLNCDLEFDHRVAPVCLGQFSDPSKYENRENEYKIYCLCVIFKA